MSRQKRARLIKLGLGVFGALTLIVVVLITALLLLDLSLFRAQLEARASDAFGRRVTFGGRIYLEPSLRPRIAIEEVRISNPDWASRPDFAHIQRIEVQLALLPLLGGELEVLDVSFLGADVLLEAGADDADNFTFGRRVGPPRLPDLYLFSLEDARVGYRTAQGALHQCSVPAARAVNTPGQPVKLDVQGLCNDVPVRLSLLAGTPEHFASPTTPWPFDLRFSTGDTRLTAEGSLPNPGAWDGARFEIAMEGKGVDSLEGLFDTDLPALGSFEFSAKLASEAGLFRLSNLAGHLDFKDTARRLDISEGEVSAGGRNPSSISLKGRLANAAFELQFAGDSVSAWTSGAKDWPLSIEAGLADARFSADGAVKREGDQAELVLQAELQGEQPTILNPLLRASLPDAGPYRLSAVLWVSRETYAISSLAGKIGSTDVAGELKWQQAGARPWLRGSLRSRFLHMEELGAVPDPDTTAKPERELLDRPIVLDWLGAFDVDLVLDVGEIVESPLPIGDISVRARLSDQQLVVSPFRAILGGASLNGDLSLQVKQGVAAARLAARAQGLELSDMLEKPESGAQVQVRAEKLEFALNGRGNTLRNLLADADVHLKAEKGQISYRGERAARTWAFEILDAEIEARESRPTEIRVSGKYGTMPLALAGHGASLATLVAGVESWPLSLELRSAQTVFAADGAISREDGEPVLDLQARLEGARVSTLNPLFQVSLPDMRSYGLSAGLRLAGETFAISSLAGKIGATDIAGNLEWDWSGARVLLRGRLASRSLYAEELFAPSSPNPRTAKISGRLDRAIPVDWLKSMDAELVLDVGRVRGGPLPIRRANMTAKLSRNRLIVSPLRATLAGAPVNGSLSVLLDRGEPVVRASARTKKIDLGELFEALGANAGIQGALNSPMFELGSRGRTPRSLLQRANLSLRTQEGRVLFAHEKLGKPREIGIATAEVTAGKGKPLSFRLEGEYRAMPLSVGVKTVNLEGLATTSTPWPLEVSLQAFEASLHAQGSVSHPLQGRGFAIAFEITGRDLKELDPLIDFVIPLQGDYRVTGRFTDDADLFSITDTQIQVGQSDIGGSIEIHLGQEPPWIRADLKSAMIHYDDLDFVEQSGIRTRVIPDYTIPVTALKSLNLDFDLAAEQIRMRGGIFGNLTVKATLVNGETVWFAQVTNERIGGRLTAVHEMDLNTDPPMHSVHLRARNLEWGILLTEAGVSDAAEGRVDVDIELVGRGASQRSFIAQADGRVRVIGGPGRISNRGLQLWTSDLFLTMLSGSWLRQPTEEINCIIGDINVADGVAKTDKLLLDTRRFTLAGTGAVDLDTEELDFLLNPKPKRRRLVSLANPVRVSGTLADPQVAVTVLPRGRTATTSGLLAGLVNPAFLLLSFSDTSVRGDPNPCVTAVETRDLGLTPDKFEVETARDLVRLCGVSALDPLYEEARAFCLAFVDGIWDYHEAVGGDAAFNPPFCPAREVTKDQAVDAFLDWADRNPRILETETAVSGLLQAFSSRWPCAANAIP